MEIESKTKRKKDNSIFKKPFILILIVPFILLSCNNKYKKQQDNKERIIYKLSSNIQDTIYNTMNDISKNIFNINELNREIEYFIVANYNKGENTFLLKYSKKEDLNYKKLKYILSNTNRFLIVKEYELPIIYNGDLDFTNINKRFYYDIFGSNIFIIDEFGDLSKVIKSH